MRKQIKSIRSKSETIMSILEMLVRTFHDDINIHRK